MCRLTLFGPTARGYLCILAAALLWASSGVVGKTLFASGVGPLELVQARVTLSTLLLTVVFGAFRPALLRVRSRDLPYFAALGGGALALVQFTYFFAISKIPVAAAILLQYLAAVFVALFSLVFWHERFTPSKAAALLLAVGGCYLAVGGYNVDLLRGNRVGILAGLASALCFAGYTLLGERGMHRYPPWTALFYALLFASLTLNLAAPPLHFLVAGYTRAQWTSVLYVAVAGTSLPFGLYFLGINHLRSSRAVITATVEPIAAALLAYALLGEQLEPLQLAGGALTLGSIVLLQLQAEHDQRTPSLLRAAKTSTSPPPIQPSPPHPS